MVSPQPPEPPVDDDLQPPPRRTARQWIVACVRDMFGTSIDRSGGRIRLVAFLFLGVYCVIGGRLLYLGFAPEQQTLRGRQDRLGVRGAA